MFEKTEIEFPFPLCLFVCLFACLFSVYSRVFILLYHLSAINLHY